MFRMLELLERNNTFLKSILKPYFKDKPGYESVIVNVLKTIIKDNQAEIDSIHDAIEDMAVDSEIERHQDNLTRTY